MNMLIKNFRVSFCLFLFTISISSKANLPEESFDLPIGFEENKGQFVNTKGELLDEVLFVASYQNMYVFITTKGISYLLQKPLSNKIEFDSIETTLWYQVDMQIEGSNIGKKNIITSKMLSGEFNYFNNHCPEGIYGVKQHKEIIIKDILFKTDMVWRFDGEELKYDFVIHPGGNPEDIKLTYIGTDRINSSHSSLTIPTPIGDITESKLVCYQDNNSAVVPSMYVTDKNNVSFDINHYDHSKPLIIDPPLTLEWATLFGGDMLTTPYRMAIDHDGNMCFGGQARKQTIFPFKEMNSSFQYPVLPDTTSYLTGSGSGLALIGKFSATGELLWCTFYKSLAMISAIEVDRYNNIFLGGYGPGGIPTFDRGFGAFYKPSFMNTGPPAAIHQNSFLLQFDQNGKRLWATYFSVGRIYSIHIDAEDNLFVGGSGLIQATTFFPFENPGGGTYFSNNNNEGGFLAKFNPFGILRWATCAENIYEVQRICSDSKNGNIFVMGSTSNSNLDIIQPIGAYAQSYSDSRDGCIIKFDKNGKRLWSTYFGGREEDQPLDMVLDSKSNLYVVGITRSDDLPLMDPGNGAYFDSGNVILGPSGYLHDNFIIKFDSFNALQWSTYWGGSGFDGSFGYAQGIAAALDREDNLYMTSYTQSADLPVKQTPCGFNHFQDTIYKSDGSVFDYTGAMSFAKFLPKGQLDWATYYAGEKGIIPTDIASGPSDDCIWLCGRQTIHATGSAYGLNLVPYKKDKKAYYQSESLTSPIHFGDGLFLRFCPQQGPDVSLVTSSEKNCPGDTVTIIMEAHDYESYIWSPDLGVSITPDTFIRIAPFDEVTYKVNVYDSCGLTDSAAITVDVSDCNNEDIVLFIPNAFAPNNNNSIFVPILSQYIIKSFRIYNIKGKFLGDFKDQNGWNGNINGNPASPGVYIYVIEIEPLQANNAQVDSFGEILTGNITLIR